MSLTTTEMTPELQDYLVSISVRDHPVLVRLREETARLSEANMQIGPEQGAFMQVLVEMLGARRCLELGVFTGYSSLVVALAMPSDGRITACDVSEEWTSIARRYWAEAGVADRIDLRLAPATETLDALLRDGAAGTYDFAFIDADKSEYDTYYERTIELLRPGGLMAIDNVFWGGEVVDQTRHDADLDAIRALNARIVTDERVTMCVVPIADGLTLARKRG
ncbi:MAG: class I SAM-dependent methyltransferase [Candidatus Limnocylindria bacterium]